MGLGEFWRHSDDRKKPIRILMDNNDFHNRSRPLKAAEQADPVKALIRLADAEASRTRMLVYSLPTAIDQ